MPGIPLDQDGTKLALYESRNLVDVQTLGVGVYEQRFTVEGNAILTTLTVFQIDLGANILVEYLDYTQGSETQTENYLPLNAHPLMTGAGASKILVPRIHNKPFLRVTITGGTVMFGIYASVNSNSASDIDNALKVDGATATLLSDKGLQTLVYDPVEGKYYFLRGSQGVAKVYVTNPLSISNFVGVPNNIKYSDLTDLAGNETSLFTYTVPVGTRLHLHGMNANCRIDTRVECFVGGQVVGAALTGPGSPDATNVWRVPEVVVAGQVVEVKATSRVHLTQHPLRVFLHSALETL